MTATTEYTVIKKSQDHASAKSSLDTSYAGSTIGITDDNGKVIALYVRKGQGFGPASVEANYTTADGNWTKLVNKGAGEYKVYDNHPAPGVYKNIRAAWKAQVEALYGVKVGR
jgi:flagellar hook assembly protein FlgD